MQMVKWENQTEGKMMGAQLDLLDDFTPAAASDLTPMCGLQQIGAEV